MAFSVFFSHGTEDFAIAKEFKDKLQEMDIATYLYEYNRRPGEYIVDKLKKAIEKADLFLVLLTKNSQYSAYLQQEIGVATGMGKLIIPLVQDGSDKKALGMLQGRDYIPYPSEYEHTDQIAQYVLEHLSKLKLDKDTKEMLMAIGIIFLLAGVLLVVTAS